MGEKKELLPIAGEPMIRVIVTKLLSSRKIDEVIVVLGERADDVGYSLLAVADERVELVGNQRYAEGMGTSLAQGVSACSWGTEAIVVVLGDTPFFRIEDVDRMIDEHAKGAKIVVPVSQGRRGHPIVFDGSYREELEDLRGDAGARYLLEREADAVREVELSDAAFLVDIDEREDYKAVKGGVG